MASGKFTYAASQTITIAPENVATSSGFTAGVESGVIDNSSNGYVDVHVGGLWTSGTTPTTNTQVLIYVVPVRDDTPTYFDVFDGTSSAETVTTAGVGRGFMRLGMAIDVDSATTARPYYAWFSLVEIFRGSAPPLKWSLFVTHNTAVNSNTTAGNHVWKYTGVLWSIA